MLYTGTRQGLWAVFTAFTASGIHHIAIGPDHILFIVGLLLLGGSIRRLLAIVTAFTLGHSVTLALATLQIVEPPARLIEPAIALSIVYVGADNLLVGQRGRDVRPWVALFFGLVHGFGFASVLRETGLPPRALGLSLFSFNLGVEIGQAAIVVAVSVGAASPSGTQCRAGGARRDRRLGLRAAGGRVLVRGEGDVEHRYRRLRQLGSRQSFRSTEREMRRAVLLGSADRRGHVSGWRQSRLRRLLGRATGTPRTAGRLDDSKKCATTCS